jgi:hypothetical protein
MYSTIKSTTLCLLLLLSPTTLLADSNSISKIEHPYIQPQEKEISLQSLYQKDNDPNKNHVLKHKLSLGRAFTDKWFAEISVSGKNTSSQNFQASSYEAEVKWQITEQGEYSADYGLLFEYENEHDIDIEEVSVSLLVEKQLGKWVGTTNLTSIYEWGKDINNEFESAIAVQAKYRYKPTLEPAIEFYAGELNKGIGPVFTGTPRLAHGKKLKWELGVIWGIDSDSADQTYRALLEYEF